jgi:serine/threonine-protein kinase
MRKLCLDGKTSESLMLRPETAQDLLELVKQSDLVAAPTLDNFIAKLPAGEGRDRVLSLLMAEGLLSRFQAAEVIAGRSRALWLGCYRVLDRLGKGGMSQVFLAEHSVLGKRVAVKVLSANLRADKVARRRFVREARAAAAIVHPNIVHVFDVDMDHDPPYLVMEYVEGVSLQAAVASSGTMTVGEVAAIGMEVAKGLSIAAAEGLVHRDIKPANLLLDRRGGVKILDLGIVRLVGDDTHPPGTEVEEILGTIDYLAPEQAENAAKVDARADLYALGATLYFLLAGHPPFPGADLRHKLAAKQFSDPPPIHRLRPDVEIRFSEVIHRLMARDPADRFASADEAAESLSHFAALPADFPSRYFRTARASTVSDGSLDEDDLLPISPTQSIRKPGFKAVAAAPHAEDPAPAAPDPAPPPEPELEDAGPPTVRLAKSLTELVLDALPLHLVCDGPEPSVVAAIPMTRKSRALRWWAVGLAALLLAAVCARMFPELAVLTSVHPRR